METLSRYKKLFLMILMAFLVYIALLLFGNVIMSFTDSARVIVFDVIFYFPLFSILYSIYSYKYYKRFRAPFVIYAVSTVTFFAVMLGVSMLFAKDPLSTSSALTLLEGLYLYAFVTSISALISIALAFVLLLTFKMINKN